MHAQLPTGTTGAKFDLSHHLWSLLVSVSNLRLSCAFLIRICDTGKNGYCELI